MTSPRRIALRVVLNAISATLRTFDYDAARMPWAPDEHDAVTQEIRAIRDSLVAYEDRVTRVDDALAYFLASHHGLLSALAKR